MAALPDLAFTERMRTSRDFTQLAALMLKSGGSRTTAATMAEQSGASGRVLATLRKAASSTSRLSDEIGEFGLLSAGFIQALSTAGIFDAVLASGAIRLDFDSPMVAAAVAVATGDADGIEGAARPIGSIHLTPGEISKFWPSAYLVATDELLRHGAAGVSDFFAGALRQAAIAAVDTLFLAELADGAASVPATSSLLADISAAADEMALTGASRLVLAAPTASVRRLALAALADGRKVHPELTVAGGTIAGVRAMPSDHLPLAGSPASTAAVLLDASQIAAASDEVSMDVARHASLQLTDDPSAGAAEMTSLWQTDSACLRVRRRIAFAPVRSTAVCVIDNASGHW